MRPRLLTAIWNWLWTGRVRGVAPVGNPLGRKAEQLAAEHLVALGYRGLARNVRAQGLEGDLLFEAPDGRTIVLVEVKSREDAQGQPSPEAAVTPEKQRKLLRLLGHLSRANRWQGRPKRIDVVAVEWTRDETGKSKAEVRHHVGAVKAM